MSIRSLQKDGTQSRAVQWVLVLLCVAGLAISTLASAHHAVDGVSVDTDLPAFAGGHEGSNGNG